MSEVVVRPVAVGDLDQLVELAGLTGFGLTTLPKDRDLLGNAILESQFSFERMSRRPAGETYLLVLEDLATKRVVGTSRIVSKVGGFEPFYGYRIETAVHESEVLKVRKEVPYLKLVTEHNGPCEVGSLFLSPEYRRDGNGRLLSLARFLFMAEHPQRFDPVVIAEMRGVIDEEGHSPFWDALGRHFFDMDFPTADYLSMVNKKFIADLMPTHPIYIPLLPQAAREVIGKVHPQTEPALHMLESEGFKFCQMIDIFDAGPAITCKRDEVRTIKQSKKLAVEEIAEVEPEGEVYLVSTTKTPFRATRARVETTVGGVRLSASTAEALNVKAGDYVRFAPMCAGTDQRLAPQREGINP